jgi:hypothetical protein
MQPVGWGVGVAGGFQLQRVTQGRTLIRGFTTPYAIMQQQANSTGACGTYTHKLPVQSSCCW